MLNVRQKKKKKKKLNTIQSGWAISLWYLSSHCEKDCQCFQRSLKSYSKFGDHRGTWPWDVSIVFLNIYTFFCACSSCQELPATVPFLLHLLLLQGCLSHFFSISIFFSSISIFFLLFLFFFLSFNDKLARVNGTPLPKHFYLQLYPHFWNLATFHFPLLAKPKVMTHLLGTEESF